MTSANVVNVWLDSTLQMWSRAQHAKEADLATSPAVLFVCRVKPDGRFAARLTAAVSVNNVPLGSTHSSQRLRLFVWPAKVEKFRSWAVVADVQTAVWGGTTLRGASLPASNAFPASILTAPEQLRVPTALLELKHGGKSCFEMWTQ